ncbi:MAG: response regulator [Desulfobacteraceae bacterium]|nr:MAG: response regulator [Desulfobacteraceae bacterium]
MRILLVDDEEELVETICERLRLRGIEAEWATSSEDALKKTSAQQFDVAVLDIKMPRVGGLELKKSLQMLWPDMKFVFLTGYGSERDFKVIMEEFGQDNYLFKPVDIDELIAKITLVCS